MTHTCYVTSTTAHQIKRAIRDGLSEVTLSLDLNLSEKKWRITAGQLVIDSNQRLDPGVLEKIKPDDKKIYRLQNQDLIPLEVRSDGYYKLVPTETAPTLEINGIKMHRSKDIDPLTDAQMKAGLVVKPNDVVLDTCGGLGYSAMWALNAGAARVMSTEKNESVLFLRELNPWLKKDDRLELIKGDITTELSHFKDGYFNSIIHDPPRFSSATGDLYGRHFYDQLNRVLTGNGRLFHYTGSPKKIKENDRFLKNTQKRLERSGFCQVAFIDRLQGFFARKK